MVLVVTESVSCVAVLQWSIEPGAMSTLSLVHSLVGVVTLYYLLSPYIIKPHHHIAANMSASCVCIGLLCFYYFYI